MPSKTTNHKESVNALQQSNTDISLAQESDIDSILNLMNICMPDLKRSHDQIHWQYFRTPFGQSKLYLVHSQGEPVALYSTFSVTLRVLGKLVPGRMQLDVMTHPDHRGKGLHSLLIGNCLKEAREAGEISFGLPNEAAEGGFRRTKGFIEVGRVPYRTHNISSDMVLSKNKINVVPIKNQFDSFAAEVWGATDFKVSIQKDSRYLNWRYSKPGEKYYLFNIANGEGVLVLKLYQSPTEKLLHICELFLKPRSEHLTLAVLEFTYEFGRRNNATVMTAWLFERHRYASAFDKFGLLLKKVNRFLFFTTECEDHQNVLSNSDAWHFTQGDSDIY